MDKAYMSIASYIKDHIDDNRPMSVDSIRRYALLGRDKIEGEKTKEVDIALDKILKENYERERFEGIHKDQSKSLAEIFEGQEKLTDVFYSTLNEKIESAQVRSGEMLQTTEGEIKQVLSEIGRKHKGFFEKQMEAIERGEREIAERFNNGILQVESSLPVIVDELKNEVAGFEKRLAKDKAEHEANLPKPPETEEIMIEETGQIITVER